ncbi:tryptophan synthase subunit alpha [Microbulbifer thermotolerans]|uniref:tryptophan synthase subunit alpha n=1 Tax=Microbulbifer thermotolerans TaxID=252514 RepID=UPI00224954DA|nr:tryptophan synthase subunit alpha [Microbulbifer thermotolerans]MCX2784296.1 tryptophan synthase subunit alpha [Microbulbifer thermotolerans]MCX2793780.1 tryptophan synthase subunit alpha [Microbulbifer thermotolerans]MCX2830181.1 tryptophan synthase subunit alpha [Microbulbifer thermotolerans]MCX2834668.1 tryptophan synthase subunit alpha [Microbulbifer thermotolerans]MCX2841217.1 tryptophan synthase subunit alpha [Microbulbifer thermotolerans]
MTQENRIDRRFAELRAEGRKALVTYIVAGDGGLQNTVPLMHQLVESGCDLIELGVPFSDPMAEGPVIQRGHERALAQGASLRACLDLVKEFRQRDTDTPVILMGYANPIEKMGAERFADAAREAGVDGTLTVDLPAEEAGPLNRLLAERNLRNIFLMTPTTSDRRIEEIAGLASGFIYYVSLKGVTGAGHLDPESVRDKLTHIRGFSDLPLCVGFGIKDGASARAVSEHGDGAVVGSLLVSAIGEARDAGAAREKVAELVSEIRTALDA